MTESALLVAIEKAIDSCLTSREMMKKFGIDEIELENALKKIKKEKQNPFKKMDEQINRYKTLLRNFPEITRKESEHRCFRCPDCGSELMGPNSRCWYDCSNPNCPMMSVKGTLGNNHKKDFIITETIYKTHPKKSDATNTYLCEICLCEVSIDETKELTIDGELALVCPKCYEMKKIGEFKKRLVHGDPTNFHAYYTEVKKLYSEVKETFPTWEQYRGNETKFDTDILRWFEKWFGVCDER